MTSLKESALARYVGQQQCNLRVQCFFFVLLQCSVIVGILHWTATLFPHFILQVFVNFAKEQCDDDQLNEVIVNNGATAVVHSSRGASPARSEQTDKPTQTNKAPQSGKSSDGKPKEGQSKEGKSKEGKSKDGKSKEGKSKEGKSKESKSKEGKSKEGKSKEGNPNGVKDNSVAMTSRPQPEEDPPASEEDPPAPEEKTRASQVASCGSSSSGGGGGGREESGTSTANGSKRAAESSSSKDPAALFLVGGDTQESKV